MTNRRAATRRNDNDYRQIVRGEQTPTTYHVHGVDYLVNADNTMLAAIDNHGRAEEIIIPGAVPSSLLQRYRDRATVTTTDLGLSAVTIGVLIGTITVLNAVLTATYNDNGDLVVFYSDRPLITLMIAVFIVASFLGLTFMHYASKKEAARDTTLLHIIGDTSYVALDAHQRARFFHGANRQDVRTVKQLLTTRQQGLSNTQDTLDNERKMLTIITAYTHPDIDDDERKELIDTRVAALKESLHKESPTQTSRELRTPVATPEITTEDLEREQRARRARNTTMRHQYRRIWNQTIAHHRDLRQRYLDTEMNWETILTTPALRDITDPYTAAMITAFNRVERVPDALPDYLAEDVDVDTPVLDVHEEDYLKRVEEFDVAFQAAVANAERIGLDLIPTQERDTIELILKLLNHARGSTTTQERATFYARAKEEIDTLVSVTIPDVAMIELTSAAAPAIETA